jgi:hypothetical protein
MVLLMSLLGPRALLHRRVMPLLLLKVLWLRVKYLLLLLLQMPKAVLLLWIILLPTIPAPVAHTT